MRLRQRQKQNVSRGNTRVNFVFLIIPLVLLTLNPDWFFTNPFIPPWFDPFTYLGLFMHPAEYTGRYPTFYPTTRVPHISLGAVFYAVLPPVAANIMFKFTILSLTLSLFYATVKTLFGRVAALASTVLLATYPFFIMSIGWDFVDSTALLFLAVCYFVAVYQLPAPVAGLREFAIGAAFAALILCNLFAVVLGPSILVLYAVRFSSNVNLRSLAKAAWTSALGMVTGIGVASGVFWALGGGSWFILGPQIQHSLSATTDPFMAEFLFASMGRLLWVAPWIAIPLATAVVAAFVLGYVGYLTWGQQTRAEDRIAVVFATNYLLLFTIFGVVTFTSLAVLTFWFYTSYLIIPAFLMLACALWYCGGDRSCSTWCWLTVGAVLAMVHAPLIGRTLQPLFGFAFGSVSTMVATAWTLAGTVTVIAGRRVNSGIACLAGGVFLGIAYLSMMTNAQMNYLVTPSRLDGFRATVAVSELFRAIRHPRKFLWIDRSEPNYYGGLFHAAFIQSHMSGGISDQVTTFPQLPPHRFQVADPVLILTTKPDWEANANLELGKVGLKLLPIRIENVAFGEIRFEAILAEIVWEIRNEAPLVRPFRLGSLVTEPQQRPATLGVSAPTLRY